MGSEDHVVKPGAPVSLSVKSESTVTLEVKAKDKEGVLRQVEITCDKSPSLP